MRARATSLAFTVFAPADAVLKAGSGIITLATDGCSAAPSLGMRPMIQVRGLYGTCPAMNCSIHFG